MINNKINIKNSKKTFMSSKKKPKIQNKKERDEDFSDDIEEANLEEYIQDENS